MNQPLWTQPIEKLAPRLHGGQLSSVELVEGLSFEELQRLTGVPLKRLATAA